MAERIETYLCLGLLMRRILIATDGSEAADRALAVAVELTKVIAGQLLVLTVSADDFTEPQNRYIESVGITVGDALEAASRGILSRAVRYSKGDGVQSVETKTGIGNPVTKIIETVSKENIDIVVVGRRPGRPRFEGLILGSVSQELAATAPCIVMIVP